MAAAGPEPRSPGLRPESLFGTQRATGLLSVYSRCAQKYFWYFALFWELQQGRYIYPGDTYIFEDKQAPYPMYYLNYLIWLEKLSNISLGSLIVSSARILLSVPGAYFHSWIFRYKWHLNSTSFLHSFQFDNSDMKTFAKDKCKVKGSKEKYYIGSPWRIFFSLIGVQSVVSDW